MPLGFDPATDFTNPAIAAPFRAQAAPTEDRHDLIPTQINGYRVTDAVQATSSDSNIVHVLAEDGRERVVWDCYRSESGEWVAMNGAYGKSRAWALGVLVKRLQWDAVPS